MKITGSGAPFDNSYQGHATRVTVGGHAYLYPGDRVPTPRSAVSSREPYVPDDRPTRQHERECLNVEVHCLWTRVRCSALAAILTIREQRMAAGP